MTEDSRGRGRSLTVAVGQAGEWLNRSAKGACRAGRRLLAAVSSFAAHAARDESWRIAFALLGAVLTLSGIAIALVGVSIALVAVTVELEDRQSERTFRAWQLVLAIPPTGSSQREAVEYLNRQFDGFVCGPWVNSISRTLTGSHHRECLFPRKERESFQGIAARGVNLVGANLAAADMRRADLTDSNLSGANLSRAALLDATLENTILRNTILTDAFLSYASLRRANLWHADLWHADLSRADLSRADLSRVSMVAANLRGADLRLANLTGAFLGYADLTNADLNRTNLTGTMLSEAILTQAQLDSACGASPPLSLPPGLIWRSKSCPPPPF